MKKEITLISIAIFLLSLNLVSAINLDVSVKPVSDSYIIDLNKPAVFDLIIKNLGDTDEFEIYSLVGVDISPETKFKIVSGETKTLRIEAIPQEALKSKIGFFTFEYLIRDSRSEIQKEKLSLNIAGLEDAILVIPQNINLNSEKMVVTIKNIIMYDFNEIKININSAFFESEETISLKSLESKQFEIPLDKEKMKSYAGGSYLMNVRFQTSGKIAEKEVMFKFLEQENIETNENVEGILIRRTEITKKNLGNVKKTVSINIQKNLLTCLFTTVNLQPTKTEIKGLVKYYIWEKELAPNEQLKVIAKTNWLYPILIILLIIGIYILIKRYIETDIMLRKKVSFVKTKGGEFALKVQIKIKARRYVEKIKITDKLPSIVNLYDKFGAVAPDKIDIENKRLEWDIEALNPKEERIFSYIIYSKIGVVGKFELYPASAVYEKDGDIKNAQSNKAFFINEPEKQKM